MALFIGVMVIISAVCIVILPPIYLGTNDVSDLLKALLVCVMTTLIVLVTAYIFYYAFYIGGQYIGEMILGLF